MTRARRDRANSRAMGGFSFVEVFLTVAILALVVGTAATSLLIGSDAIGQSFSAGALQADAQRTLERITAALGSANASGADPIRIAPLSSSSLTYQRSVGFENGSVVWGPTERIRFQIEPGELDDGLDNNGNGLIDEGQVVWTINVGESSERSVVWARSVREFLEGETSNNLDDNGNGLEDEAGLSFDFEGTRINIRLTLEKQNKKGNRIRQSVQTSLTLRN